MPVAEAIQHDALAGGRQAASVACAHCGLDVPSGLIDANESAQFCCGGCRAAYSILHEHGLEHYYDFVERRGA
ncbi:MAG TPA: heavy metal translocating P-type ATPase metal-binding domain-containing protein, partial [Gemmatimonadaceae bacterium]|nr:heavy metal translocating P-type ATPase metal-binding domain-containing protein [Gemmatimonadaceae bacterium]